MNERMNGSVSKLEMCREYSGVSPTQICFTRHTWNHRTHGIYRIKYLDKIKGEEGGGGYAYMYAWICEHENEIKLFL